MNPRFQRQRLLLGDSEEKLFAASVAVFGIGGVGSFAAEALARAGIGQIDLFDKDVVDITNTNRQLIALSSTIGKAKVDIMRDRIIDINPDVRVNVHHVFYGPDNASSFDLSKYDYIIDAIDTVTSKIILIEAAKAANIPIISCMGAGNKFDPTAFRVADLSETRVCPLAKVMRRELKVRGIESLRVVFSTEAPARHHIDQDDNGTEELSSKRSKIAPGSMSFVPPVAGMILAGEVIKDLALRSDLRTI